MNTNDTPHNLPINNAQENSMLRVSGVTEQAIAQGTLGIHNNVAQAVHQLQEKQRGFISRFFTEKGLTKVLQDQKIQSVRDFAEYQRTAFRLATDTKLDMAHSMCLAMSRELKVGNQERFTAMVLDKHESLRRTVQSKREGFLADMDAAYDHAERFAHRPWLADRAITSLQKEVEQFYAWIDGLLDDFLSISKQRLDEYRKAEVGANTRPTLGNSGGWNV